MVNKRIQNNWNGVKLCYYNKTNERPNIQSFYWVTSADIISRMINSGQNQKITQHECFSAFHFEKAVRL